MQRLPEKEETSDLGMEEEISLSSEHWNALQSFNPRTERRKTMRRRKAR